MATDFIYIHAHIHEGKLGCVPWETQGTESQSSSILQSGMGEDDKDVSGARNLGVMVGPPLSSALQL